MTITKIDPPGLHPLVGGVHVTVAEGSRIIHLSGQTGVDRTTAGLNGCR